MAVLQRGDSIESSSILACCILGAMLYGSLAARSQSLHWVKTAGGVDEDAGLALTVSARRELIIGGHFAAQSTLGKNILESAGGLDVFAGKLDAGGNVIWARRFGGPETDDLGGIAVDRDGNILMAGVFAGKARFDNLAIQSAGATDAFVVKLDPMGNALWALTLGGPARDAARSIAIDGAGNCYVTGSYLQTAKFGSTQLNGGTLAQLFLTKHAPDGAVRWARNTGGGENAVGNGVAADDHGNVWCAGHYFPGSPPDLSNSDAILARFDASGGTVWYRVFGGPQPDSAQAVTADATGHCYATGFFNGMAKFGDYTLTSRGGRDVFVLKCDPAGKVVWARRAGGNSEDQSACVAVDKDGSCYIGGDFQGDVDFGAFRLSSPHSADPYVAKYDANGQVLWVFQAKGTVNMHVAGLGVDDLGEVFSTGYFRYNTAFDGIALTNHGSGKDTFVARLDNPALPLLSIQRNGGDTLLAWPSGSVGFHLESSPEIGTRTTWRAVTNLAALAGGRLFLTNPFAQQQRFFRMAR